MAAGCVMGLAEMVAGGESPGGVRGKVATPGGECGGCFFVFFGGGGLVVVLPYLLMGLVVL